MRLFLTALAVLLIAAGGRDAAAASSEAIVTPESAVRLVTAVAATGTLEKIPAGIEIELQPGWKTYWRSPGDAGYPLAVEWQGSENLAEAELHWPVPHRFTLFGLDTFGYADRVLFPVTLVPETPGDPMRLVAQARYLICEEICIPYEATLTLDLPAGEASTSPEAQLIDRFESQVPGDGADHGIEIASARIALGATPEILVSARSDLPFVAPDLLVEGPGSWRFPAPQLVRGDNGREATLTIVPERLTDDAPPLDEAALTLTLVDGIRGAEFQLIQDATASASNPFAGLLPMLLVALVGGLILNLMPCVLPVLSLKLLSIVGHGGGEARAVRGSFLATSAGIVVSFLLLAAALIALRAGGTAIGWGIQFQQPVFLLAMASIVTLFAANLAGWFEIPLPSWIGNRGATVAREQGGSLSGAFATGMLATLLATPCSAPFVGTAVGFALARGTGEILTIFMAMGVGLALPYLLVALWPRLATALPRPGRWMVWLRRLLALALVGTAVWLLSIVAGVVGPPMALVATALLAAILVLLWLGSTSTGGLKRAIPVAVIVLVGAVLLPAILDERTDGTAMDVAAEDDALWQNFDRASIPALVGEGRTVFVDVTADWCITCEVNKTLVLDRTDVARRLADPSVTAMRADWTRPDDAIADYLESFGRYGIPFNVVYGPGAPQGIVLPELLDRDGVLAALDRAAHR